jgi:hypothetical protein
MEEVSGKPAAGVIGLGLIGSRVAACLRRSGYQVWLWNRTVRPEPNFLSSPAEIAEAARYIQIFVSDGDALHAVLRAMLPALTAEHVILNHATVSPADTLVAAEIVAEKHASFLDAPFTGSRDAAAAGQLVYYIGGEPQVLERVRTQLGASSKQILQIGGIGQASVVKVATNLISANAVASLAEAFALPDDWWGILDRSLRSDPGAAVDGFEQSLRTPLVVRWPGVVPAGSKNGDLVSNLDFAPTFLTAAGVTPPADMQGKPLQPLLRGQPAPADWRKSFYYRYYELGTHNVAAHEAVVTADHKLIHYTARLNQGKREAIDEWDLIDRRLDPQEMRSFYAEPSHQPIREALHRELERLRVELKAD